MRFDTAGVVRQIQRHASQFPQAAAAYHRDQALTYEELRSKSLSLSLALKHRGVREGSVIGVCVRPGFDILLALIAIFRCRAIYLPLDPDHPSAHLRMIAEDAAPQLILSHSSLPGMDSIFACRSLAMDSFDYKAISATDDDPAPCRRDESPAYLMYTSGTTGIPKGVLVSNANLHFYLSSAQEAFRFRPADIFCNIARYTFSISLFDLLLPLCVGASVRLLDRNDILDFSKLLSHLSHSTVLHAGPSLLATLFRYMRNAPDDALASSLRSLRHVSSGGDIVLPVLMEAMRDHFPEAELYVIYGSTEISCMGTYFPLPRHSLPAAPMVGSPFPKVSLLLLDEEGREAALGSMGEICFAGDGVGLGYRNKPELSAEKLIRHASSLFYRTGDYGRLHANGDLEMIGRRDFQAKLRGIRVELTAIENCIISLGCAVQCVVVHRSRQTTQDPPLGDESDTKILIAFLVGARGTAHEISAILSRQLPQEIIPSLFIELDSLPVSFNGKLDRKQLLSLPLAAPRKPNPPSRMTPLEDAIAELFSSLLAVPRVDADDNFFELGGHSLLAVLLLGELDRRLGIRLTPHLFFQAATVRSVARHGLTSRSGDPQRDDASSPQAKTPPCSIVPLAVTSRQRPIFVLSGVHVYRSLAQHLEHDWSVYGIISERDLGDETGDGSTIEDLARDYADAIQRNQQEGPYHILGYSFAGILAFEVAKQLTALGHEVSKLILVDSTLPEWVLRGRYQLGQLSRLLRVSPKLLWPYLWNKLKKKGRTLRRVFSRAKARKSSVPSKDSPYELRLHAIEKQRGHRNRLYAEEYMKRIKRYSGHVTLFVAERRLARKPLRSRSGGWQRYTASLETILLNADHSDVLEDGESLRRIAREIKPPDQDALMDVVEEASSSAEIYDVHSSSRENLAL